VAARIVRRWAPFRQSTEQRLRRTVRPAFDRAGSPDSALGFRRRGPLQGHEADVAISVADFDSVDAVASEEIGSGRSDDDTRQVPGAIRIGTCFGPR